MCGLKASDVREELVSAAGCEGGRAGFCLWGNKASGPRRFLFATSAGRPAWACWQAPRLLWAAGTAGCLVRVRVRVRGGTAGARAWCTVLYAPSGPDLLPAAWPRGTLLRCTLTHSTSRAPTWPCRGGRPRREEALRLQVVSHRVGETHRQAEAAPVPSLQQTHTAG